MAQRRGWRRVVLVLMLMLISLPAMAGGRVSGRRGEGRGWAAVWRVAVRWVVPAGWLAKLGPGMDPDGVTGTAPGGGAGDSARSGDLGPDIDPNG